MVDEAVQKVLKKIHWLGHDAFRIDADKVIYIDPYQLEAGEPKADIILITHDHFDHYSPDDVKKLLKPGTTVVSIAAVTKKVRGAAVETVKPGDKVTVQGIPIEAVPAYNVDKQFHPKSAGHVGFIVTVDGVRIYHAGDTDFIPEMKDFRVDIALLPVSGTYVMTAEEAVQAAGAIKPKLAIPMHYGAIVGGLSDAQRFAQACPVETVILERS
ncbi:MAG: MBL fold metallo-hydrolase [Anaerolineae bacterium]|nr:MBL fold metallo-hydrolase [Anaerolineae bacterium]